MPGPEVPQPPPENVTPTGGTPEKLPDVSGHAHVLSDIDREKALTGTHPAQQTPKEAAPSTKPSIRGKSYEELMKLDPLARMAFVQSLPPERRYQTSKQLEVPPPISGGAVEVGEGDMRTPFERLLDERDGVIATTGNYATLSPEDQQRVDQIDEEIGTLVRTAQRLSGFKILPREKADTNYDAIYQRAILAEGILTTRDPNLQGIMIYSANRAQSRAIGDPSLGPERDWEWKPPVVDIFIPPEPPPEGSSLFQETLHTYKHLQQLARFPQNLTPQQQTELPQRLRDTERTINDLIDRAERAGIITLVRTDLKAIYSEVKSTTTSGYGTRASSAEQVMALQRAVASYQEPFWNDRTRLRRVLGNVNFEALRAEYRGVGIYLAPEVELAIEADLKGEPPGTERGDRIFEDIKRERTAERQRATPDERLAYSLWRERFDFSWPENYEELELAVFDWLGKFEQALPEEAAQTVHERARLWRGNATAALEAAFHRLRIPEKSPEAKRLKATVEAYVDVLGGVKLLESGREGFDAYTQYLEDFSHNFNAHHDAIYLGNAKSAIIQDFLSQNDGAISLSGFSYLEKPQAGETSDFREDIELRAKQYAATHELYIRKSDFDAAEAATQADIQRITDEVTQLNISPEKANEIIARRIQAFNRRYWWNDEIEELLLTDRRGMAKAQAITDPAERARAIARVNTRTAVFKTIKDRLDREDGLFGKTEVERRAIIRQRIRNEMTRQRHTPKLREIDAITDQTAKDRALWQWVKEFNEKRQSTGVHTWFPSSWDMVRLSIATPTKLIDRALSKEEFRAMIEEVEDPYKYLTRDQIEALSNLTDQQKEELLFDQERRWAESERAFNINRAYQKFLGVDARWGGMVFRDIGPNGEVRMQTISGRARDILKAKIDAEEQQIEDKVNDIFVVSFNSGEAGMTHDQIKARADAYRASLIGSREETNLTFQERQEINERTAIYKRGLNSRAFRTTPGQLEEAKTRQRRLLRRNTTFGATLALRELGLGNDLPIWDYRFYGDEQLIQALAPYAGYTHDEKAEVVVLLDQGRRETKAVFDYLAKKYMDGKILVVQDDPVAGWHKEILQARARVINKGGDLTLRALFDSRFMFSTSGGVEMVDLITKIADLGVYDLLWEMGCQDFREFHSYIKRRDEVELKKQSFWDIDRWQGPKSYAQRLRAAETARKALGGGKIEGKGDVPGLLIEPFSGLFRYRDELLRGDQWINTRYQRQITQRDLGGNFKKELMEILEKAGVTDLDPAHVDRLIEVGTSILDPLITYMNARKYVMNRAGLAPKNWKLDNELFWQAYKQEMLRRLPKIAAKGDLIPGGKGGWKLAEGGEQLEDVGGEKLGADDFDYAIQGRTPLAIKVMDAILRTSSYHILVPKDQRRYAGLGRRTKERLDVKRAEIAARPLTDEVQAKIAAREDKLRAQHTSDEALTKEIQRLKDEYIDERLHKEFVGEWSASYASILESPKTVYELPETT